MSTREIVFTDTAGIADPTRGDLDCGEAGEGE